MRFPAIAAAALAATLLATSACNKPAAPLPPLEHVDSVRREPNRFIHKTFQVKKIAQFSFVVPPRTAIPHLQGTFSSFVPRKDDDPLSDDTTNVEFLLLNPEQYADFTDGNVNGTALYSTEPTHNHEVDFSLAPTGEDSATYYVIFRSTPGGAPLKSVKADFTVSYGY